MQLQPTLMPLRRQSQHGSGRGWGLRNYRAFTRRVQRGWKAEGSHNAYAGASVLQVVNELYVNLGVDRRRFHTTILPVAVVGYSP